MDRSGEIGEPQPGEREPRGPLLGELGGGGGARSSQPGEREPRGPLLEVNLSADYPERQGVLEGVSFTIGRGEIFGLIGRSGSGKSTIALALLRLLELRGGRVRGTLRFCGRDLMALDGRALRDIRGREIGFVPQSPMSALNPALHIETQFREAWRAHRSEPWAFAKGQVRELLGDMGLPTGNAFLGRYPRQLSVGQAQRVTIAMAILHGPKLLIADEATSALDPGSQDEILHLFERLNRTLGMAILYISHDMVSVARLCRTAVLLEGGRAIEAGPAARLANGGWLLNPFPAESGNRSLHPLP
jgi:ABC-type glutathione transport system ATPase component